MPGIKQNQWRTEEGVWGIQPPPPTPKFRRPPKIVPNSTRLWKLLKIAEFRKPTPQDVGKKGSKFPKFPSVRNCFILVETNKLVVIINSLKVPKIKKMLLYEMKFLVANYSCLQNPWLGGLPPTDPRSLRSLSSTEFVETPTPPEQNSWVRHWTERHWLYCRGQLRIQQKCLTNYLKEENLSSFFPWDLPVIKISLNRLRAQSRVSPAVWLLTLASGPLALPVLLYGSESWPNKASDATLCYSAAALYCWCMQNEY